MNMLADVHSYSPERNEWTSYHGVRPRPRSGHSMCQVNNDSLWLFGGVDGEQFLQTVELFKVRERRRGEVGGRRLQLELVDLGESGGSDLPAARSRHSMTALGGDGGLYVFGGGDGPQLLFNDVHRLDATSGRWQSCRVKGPPPSKRWAHSAVAADSSTLVLFGGWSDRGACNDVHVLDARCMQWALSSLSVSSEGVAPCASHAAARVADDMVVWGGGDAHSEPIRSLRRLDLRKLKWRAAEPISEAVIRRADAPLIRFAHTADAWKDGKRMFVFGGTDGAEFFNSLLEIELSGLGGEETRAATALAAPPTLAPENAQEQQQPTASFIHTEFDLLQRQMRLVQEKVEEANQLAKSFLLNEKR